MKTIRNNVFETNSSSTHSVSIHRSKNGNLGNLYFLTNDNDEFLVRFGEFGWENSTYLEPDNKLAYALTMVLETEFKHDDLRGNWIKRFKNTNGFKKIDEVVYNRDKKHISLDNYEDETILYKSDLGYIDHQSCEGYNSLQNFLDDYGITIEDFIYNDNVAVHTSNDNGDW